MRALHVFPLFSTDRTSGAAHYQWSLTRALQDRGVAVEVFTTTTDAFEPAAAFGLRWPRQRPAGVSTEAGVVVHRFPVTFSPSHRFGRILSRTILDRWVREGTGPGLPPEELQSRASSRPRIFDILASLGRGPISLPLLRALMRDRHRFDVILVGYLPFALIEQVVAVAGWLGKPVAVLPLFHASDPYHHFGSFFRALGRADRVLPLSDFAAGFFEACPTPIRTTVVGAGVDGSHFASGGASGRRFRDRYGLGDAPIVLQVGRKERGKRWDLSVEAIERVTPREALLVLVGEDVDRVPVPSPRVRILGSVEDADLHDAYDACAMLVHPSENESFGMVLLEAWSHGRAVIGRRSCAAVASIIDEGRDGLLCEGVDELAKAIEGLLLEPARARLLGEAGQAKVREHFTWDAVAARVETVYANLVATAH